MNIFNKNSCLGFKIANANFRYRSSQAVKSPNATKTGTTVRTTIAKSIAKNFNNVSLVEFPLHKPESLSDYAVIDKAHQQCHKDNLDENHNYYPSISTILNQTMSPESLKALKRWEAEKIKYGQFLLSINNLN